MFARLFAALVAEAGPPDSLAIDSTQSTGQSHIKLVLSEEFAEKAVTPAGTFELHTV